MRCHGRGTRAPCAFRLAALADRFLIFPAKLRREVRDEGAADCTRGRVRSPDKCVPVNVDGRVVMLPFSLQLLIPSVLGGLIGAVLLSRTDSRNFVQFVPWLVLVAAVIIVLLPILVGRD